MIRRRHAERFLAREMMEERALRHARRRAEVVDAGAGVALRADHAERGIEQLGTGGDSG